MSNIVKKESVTEIVTDTGTIKLSPAIIKEYLVRGNGDVSNQEVMMFLSLCKFQKLNPFLNECYLIKFGRSPASIVVGKETFTKRAFNHPKFKGLTAGIIIERDGELMDLEGTFKKPSDILLGGWAIVHVEGRTPFKNTVSMEEYVKYKSDGAVQSTWKSMPATMIRKVALVQALREAFPEYFQAMYSQEEMPEDNAIIDSFDKIEMPEESKVEDLKEYVDEAAEILEAKEETETDIVTDKSELIKHASNIEITFGQHAGKLLGEVFETDKKWVETMRTSKSADIEIKNGILVLEENFK